MTGTKTGHFDVAVVGSGIQGASAAFYLSRQGKRVVLLDRDFGGRHSSSVNAGGVRTLWRATEELPLALAAMEIWPRLEQLVGSDCGFRTTGQLKVAETPADMRALEDRIKLTQSLGFSHERLIERRQLQALVPDIARHCVGAIWVEGDGYGSPFATTSAFQAAAEKSGATIVRHAPVTGIHLSSSHWVVTTAHRHYDVEYVVNCAGAWGDTISTMVGEPVPLSVEAPMMMVSAPVARFLTPVVGCVGRKLSFKQIENGAVLIGGGYRGMADRDTGLTQLRFDRLAESAKSVIDLFPACESLQIVRCWAGIEGLTPDKLPFIGNSRHEGVFHAFGFSSHGYQLGPIVGKVLADLIIRGKSDYDLKAFSINRFNSAS